MLFLTKKYFALIVLILGSLLQCYYLEAQEVCGFDKYQNELMKDQQYAANVIAQRAKIQSYIAAHPELKISRRSVGPLYTIPVVVHVIHTGDAIGTLYNPSDAQIQGTIDYLNSIYSGSFSGVEGVGDVEIQFALAKRDPNCNPTNGIDRVNASALPGYTTYGVDHGGGSGVLANQIKDLYRWDPYKYYNIYVVNKIDGKDGTSGQYTGAFASIPAVTPNYDGTIILAKVMVQGEKALPHEIGHALDLYHPFQGSSDRDQCPTNNDCTKDGDFVCDTDPVSYNQKGGVIDFSCRTGTNPCTGTSYSANTEHNFMNYTNCFTLFTAGQKARMLAAMTTYSNRKSLVDASNMALVPTTATPSCSPKINFELKETLLPETSSGTIDCRGYKDYTFNMTIGSAPVSSNAVVQLAISGTAYAKADYDITTNGSFTSPSTVLTFPAGATTSIPFTVRIYDDKAIEPTESIVIDFSVTGGGAVKGDLAPTMTINIANDDTEPIVPGAPASSVVGSGNTSFSPHMFSQVNSKVKSQILYTAKELKDAGIPPNATLKGISFYVQQKNTTAPYTGLTVKLVNTSTTILRDASTHALSGLTTVGNYASYSTTADWNDFVFDSPFVWDGVSNLGIEICWDNGVAGTLADNVIGYVDDGGTAGNSNFIFNRNGSMTCSGSFSGGTTSLTSNKPNLKIAYGLPGNTVATVVSTSQTQYLGPYADVYFVSVDGKLLARVNNLTEHDYGCTSVTIDREGTNASPFWDTKASHYLANKTLKVVPTNNTTNGSYAITLYYKTGEVAGWQTATGESLNNAKMVKVTNGYYVPDVTPSTPHSQDVSSVSSTNAPYASDFAITGNFSNAGFSGFGIGIPVPIPLPIDFISFTGEKQNANVVLNWKVATNEGIKLFEIERSSDGIKFSKLGTVSALPSLVASSYQFTDQLPLTANNYYRIREIEVNGDVSYSKIISISGSMQSDNISIYPNPATSQLTIDYNGKTAACLVKIFSMDGKLVKQVKNSNVSGKMNLNIIELPAGHYLIQLITENGNVVTKKFVKQ